MRAACSFRSRAAFLLPRVAPFLGRSLELGMLPPPQRSRKSWGKKSFGAVAQLSNVDEAVFGRDLDGSRQVSSLKTRAEFDGGAGNRPHAPVEVEVGGGRKNFGRISQLSTADEVPPTAAPSAMHHLSACLLNRATCGRGAALWSKRAAVRVGHFWPRPRWVQLGWWNTNAGGVPRHLWLKAAPPHG